VEPERRPLARPVQPYIGAIYVSTYADDGSKLDGATASIFLDTPVQPLEARCMLVTALHVLTGRNPYVQVPSETELKVPVELGLRVLSRSKSDPEERRVPLYDNSGRGVWLESDHEVSDVAAIDVTKAIEGTSAPIVDRFDEPARRHLKPFLEPDVRVGDHLVLAAFPYGRQGLELFPLTLQALLATDLDSVIRTAPEATPNGTAGENTTGFLIDCVAAAPGCHGGLVYLYERSWPTRAGFTVGLSYRVPIPLGMYIGPVDQHTTLGSALPLSTVTDVAFHGVQTEAVLS
jgi:hypothetical protein